MRRIVWLSLALSFGTHLAAAEPARTPWTVLLYWAADGDLDEPGMATLEEVAAAVRGDAVNVLALVDRRAPSAPRRVGLTRLDGAPLDDWKGARLLRLRRGHAEDLLPRGGGDGSVPDPEVDMASPRTLAAFLSHARRVAPAERTALVVFGHGDGPFGLCRDEAPGPVLPVGRRPVMSFPELALACSDFARAEKPLDLLVLDACQCASLDGLLECWPWARYAVAGEDVVGERALAHAAALRALCEAPETSAEAFGALYVRSYGGPARATGPGPSGNLSLLDLSRVPAVVDDLHALGTALTSAIGARGAPAWQGACAAFLESPALWRNPYRRGSGPGPAGSLGLSTFSCGAVDALRAAEALAAHEDPAVRRAAAGLARDLEAMVLRTKAPRGQGWMSGLSLYVPWDRADLDAAGMVLGLDHPWRLARAALVDGMERFARDVEVHGLAVEFDACGSAPAWVASATLGPTRADVADARFAVAFDRSLPLGALPARVSEGGEAALAWDGGWFFLRSGGGPPVLLAPLRDVARIPDGTGSVRADAVARFAGHPVALRLRLTPQGRTWTATLSWLDAGSGATATSTTLRTGDEIAPGDGVAELFPAAAGGSRRVPDWARRTARAAAGEDGPDVAVVYLPLPEAPAWAGIIARGFDGRAVVEWAPLSEAGGGR